MSNPVYKRNESENDLLFEDLHDNVGDDSEDCPTVNILVRRSYYECLKKLLIDNVNYCQKNNLYSLNHDEVHKCAQHMELRALKASMATELYRLQMLKEIRIIRENTENGLLFINNPTHCEILEKSCTPDNTNVADDYNISDNPPQNCNDNICVQAPNMLVVENLPETITTVDNPNTDSPDAVAKDGIMEKLQNIFGSEDNELIETIFGVNDENTIQSTSNELNSELRTNQSTSTAVKSPELTLDDHPYIGYFQKKTVKKYSFWSLEDYIHSAIFRQKICIINEMNPVKCARVMKRLTNYFGDDSNIDLQTPVNLEELKCVCRNRVSHFVVSCLTVYYKSRIKSREIFKMLSRSMTTVILQLDPYIDAAVVHKAIKEFFRRHRSLKVELEYDVEYVIHHIKFYISRDCN